MGRLRALVLHAQQTDATRDATTRQQVLHVAHPRECDMRQARRQRVLAMLDANPTARYALLTDMQADPEAVLLTLAIRGRATCELRIPRDRYDGVLLLDLIERHGAMTH